MNILIILIICLTIYIIIDNNSIHVYRKKVCFTRKKIKELNVLQITDLHDRTFGGRLSKKINKEKVDVICFTGDMENTFEKNTFIPFVKTLNKDKLMLYVDGNNGKQAMMIESLGLTSYGKKLEKLGVKILRDFYVLEEEKICFVNSDVARYITDLLSKDKKLYYNEKDYNNKHDTRYKAEFIEKLKEYKRKYLIVGLGHYPFNIKQLEDISKRKYNSLYFDINVTGHYHGGQFRIPFIGALFVPSINSDLESLFPKDKEVTHFQRVNNICQYIGKGLGATDADLKVPILQFRFFNTPEYSILRLTNNTDR